MQPNILLDRDAGLPASSARAGRSRQCQSKWAGPRVSALGTALVTAPFLIGVAPPRLRQGQLADNLVEFPDDAAEIIGAAGVSLDADQIDPCLPDPEEDRFNLCPADRVLRDHWCNLRLFI